jgi:chorismate mutase
MTTVTTPDATAPAAPDAAVDDIDALRSQIDDLDLHIARLVADRAAVSKRIQAARISSGGTRFELSRERVVLDHYRAQLGSDGPGLAESILRICRGTR